MLTLLVLQSYLVNEWKCSRSTKIAQEKKFSSLLKSSSPISTFFLKRWFKLSSSDNNKKRVCVVRNFNNNILSKMAPKTTKDMSLEEKFKAAVKVIYSLPKDGPYQPSNGTKLKFYGLFKQATEGACGTAKPGFWDVIGKYKWEAWNNLGQISKEEAMQEYVENLKGIVETMSWDGNVQDFLNTIGPFYEFVNLNGPEMNHIRETIDRLTSSSSSSASSPINSCPNSPLKSDKEQDSDERAEVHVENSTATFNHIQSKPITNGYHNHEDSHLITPPTPQHTYSRKNSLAQGHPNTNEQEIINEDNEETSSQQRSSEKDEVIGVTISTINQVAKCQADLEQEDCPQIVTRLSIEATSGTEESEKYYSGDSEPDFDDKAGHSRTIMPQFYAAQNKSIVTSSASIRNKKSSPKCNGGLNSFLPPSSSSSNGELILDRLNRDVDHILARLRILETAYAASANNEGGAPIARRRRRFLGGFSYSGILFIVMWPFAVHFLIKLMSWWWARRRILRRLLGQ